jgi:hypothetical protein
MLYFILFPRNEYFQIYFNIIWKRCIILVDIIIIVIVIVIFMIVTCW